MSVRVECFLMVQAQMRVDDDEKRAVLELQTTTKRYRRGYEHDGNDVLKFAMAVGIEFTKIR